MSNSTNGLPLSPAQVDDFLAAARRDVAKAQFDANDRDRLQTMVACLGDSRGMVRLGFADTLGRIGKPATPFLIEALLYNADPVVRRASAKTLTLIADPDTVRPLVQALLEDQDTVVQGSSVGALARIGEASVPILLEILASPERPESMKGHAAWALAFIGSAAKEYLYREVNSESPSVRVGVIGAIAKLAQDSGEPEAFDLLIKALGDESETVCVEAAAVLGNLAHTPAVPTLIERLEHPSSETRKAAALSLMKIGDDRALRPLQTALEQEANAELKPIFNLALTQLQRQLNADE